MSVQLEVSWETAQILRANASARQISLDAYLRSLAEADSISVMAGISLAEFDRDMDQLAAGSESLPILPNDFSRADIYHDHD